MKRPRLAKAQRCRIAMRKFRRHCRARDRDGLGLSGVRHAAEQSAALQRKRA